MNSKIMMKSLDDTRSGRTLFVMCFMLYSVALCGRLNYASVLAKVIWTGFLEKDVAGLIATAFNVTYGCCQFVSGFIADKLPPFGTVSVSILGAATCNICMYFAMSNNLGLPVYIAIWILNGVIQSIIWPTLIRILSRALPEKLRVTAGVSMLATTAVGSVISYILSSAIIRFTDWKKCFLFPSIILVILSASWFVLTRGFSRKTIEKIAIVPENQEENAAQKASSKINDNQAADTPLMKLLIASGALFMLIPIGLFSVVKEGISTWTPTIITEIFNADPSFATFASTILPFISIFGAAIAKIMMDKLFHDEMKAAAALFGFSSVTLLLVIIAGKLNIFTTIIMLSAIIAFLLGVNTIFISLVPLRFGKYGRAATMTGVLNSVACIGGGLSSFIVGVLAKAFDWNFVFMIFMILCAIGCVVTALIVRRWMKFRADT